MFLVPLKGGRWHSPSPNWQVLYHLYTTYSPCLLGGEICYRSHLLGEPKTTIDQQDVMGQPYGFNGCVEVQLTEGMDATEREIAFVRWSTPLIVSWFLNERWRWLGLGPGVGSEF